jgi:hypothetical protein
MTVRLLGSKGTGVRLWQVGDPSGLPRNGLVGLYDPYRDTYGRNVLPVGAEDFAFGHGWYKGVTYIGSGTAPDVTITSLGNGRYRLTAPADGTATVTMRWLLELKWPVTGSPSVFSIMGKANAGSPKITFYKPGGTAITPLSFPSTEGAMTRNFLSTDGTAGTGFACICAESATAALDVEVAFPQFNLGSTLFPYSAPSGVPSTLQTGTDYSGNGNHLTLGATTNASTDDPAYTGTAWSFDGGDYLKAADSATLDVGQFSVIGVAKIAPSANVSALWDKSLSTGTTVGCGAIFRTSDPYFVLYTYDTSLHRTGGTVANVRDDAWHTIGGTMRSGAQAIYVDGVKVASDTLVYAEDSVQNSYPIVVFAQNSGYGPTPGTFSTGSLAFLAIWNRALASSEYLRAYQNIKGLMAQRGITLP